MDPRDEQAAALLIAHGAALLLGGAQLIWQSHQGQPFAVALAYAMATAGTAMALLLMVFWWRP